MRETQVAKRFGGCVLKPTRTGSTPSKRRPEFTRERHEGSEGALCNEQPILHQGPQKHTHLDGVIRLFERR